MDTVTLLEPGRFEFHQSDEPTRASGEALVRVHRVGVCGTDLHAFAGQQNFFEFPRILGHELGVEILELDAADAEQHGLAVGDLCAIEPFLCDPDGACPAAIRERTPNATPTMRVLGVHSDGGMRERFCVPADRLHPSAKLAPDDLCLVEPLSISDHAVNRRARIQNGERVLVVGVGPIGLAAVQFALAAGGSVEVLERSTSRRAHIAKHFGISCHEALSEDARYDVVLDATGNRHAMEASFSAVEFGGRLVFIGHTKGQITFENPLFHSREMTVMSSRNSHGRFRDIIGMIEAGAIDTAPWITHRMPLANVPDEFGGLAGTEGLMKCVIEI